MHQQLPSGDRPWQDYPNIAQIEVPGRWEQGDRRSLSLMLLQLLTIRRFGQWLLDNQEAIYGPVHSGIGQEAVAVGAMAALRQDDLLAGGHRAVHHVLAKVMAARTPAGFDPLGDQPTPAGLFDAVHRTMAEIMGLRSGWAGGRAGEAHLSVAEAGAVAMSSIIGGALPIACGAALAARWNGSNAVALSFCGDGATSIGAFHEGLSLARVWNLPVILLVENNLYSVATTVEETVGFPDIVIRSSGQNIPGLIVDGMDPIAVREAVSLAREHAVAGRGPVLIEARTYRYYHQHGNLPGSAYKYRSVDEEAAWRARDPLTTFPERLMSAGVLDQHDLKAVVRRGDELVDSAVERCTVVREGVRVVPADLLPSIADLERGVVSDGREFASVAFAEPEDLGEGPELSFVDAVSLVIHRSMQRDPRVFVIGEEVGHLRGGAYGTTKHAFRDYPDRLLSTPICENGFSGVALGAALTGTKPIVEIMFPDFALEGADQLLNHIPKARYMYGGEVAVPLIVRTRTAQGRGFGPQHSSDPAALFALFPGWRIVAPSTPADYVGLFNAALISDDPVLIIEHYRLWADKGVVPNLDFVIPFGKAKIRRRGSDVTVLSWSHPVHRALASAERLAEEGISAEVIDLRTLDRAGLDVNSIMVSVARTGALVIVEDASRSHSMGVQIADHVSEFLFPLLCVPIKRVCGKDVPTPISKPLETAAHLQDEDIDAAIRWAARYKA